MRFTLGRGLPVPIVQEAGWAPEPVWTQRLEEKSFASAGAVFIFRLKTNDVISN
jgi:hypothetical protein